jgi:hypothetical protein
LIKPAIMLSGGCLVICLYSNSNRLRPSDWFMGGQIPHRAGALACRRSGSYRICQVSEDPKPLAPSFESFESLNNEARTSRDKRHDRKESKGHDYCKIFWFGWFVHTLGRGKIFLRLQTKCGPFTGNLFGSIV